jgi:hypothetical protein
MGFMQKADSIIYRENNPRKSLLLCIQLCYDGYNRIVFMRFFHLEKEAIYYVMPIHV